jgi:hypothetical protein
MIYVAYFVVMVFGMFCGVDSNAQVSTISQGPVSSSKPIFFDGGRKNSVHVSYIYAPCLMGTELLMGRYCPRFIASTQEKITWQSGGRVIGHPHKAVIFPEIDIRKPKGFTFNPVRAWFNGVRQDIFPVMKRFFEETFNFSVEDNPDNNQSVVNFSLNLWQANVGQRKDIKALHKTYRQHIKQYPQTNVVLYGDSRGAATIFNFIATYKPAHVKAAVLEGIFDDIPHVIKHVIYNNKGRCAEARLHSLFALMMRSYSKKGPFPRDYAEKITDDIPLLLVTSLQDGLVAPQCTLSLYNRLRQRGHKKVHVVILEKSFHPFYMIDNPLDKNKYETVVHAFYEHYGLPHNRVKAAEGKKEFLMTQPSVKEVKKRYPLYICDTCKGLL